MPDNQQRKDEVAAWQKRIEDAFAGPSGIVGERLMSLYRCEETMKADLIRRFRGYVVLMDSFFDFYIHTLQALSALSRTSWPEPAPLIATLGVVSLWRWRSAYQCFWNGYFGEALSLLRSVLENVFLLTALENRIVTTADVFGRLREGEAPNWSESKLRRHFEETRKEVNRKILEHVLGSSSGLSAADQKSLRRWRNTLHGEVHGSHNELTFQYHSFIRGQPVYPFPNYDEERATQFTNSSIFLSHLATRSFPLFQLKPKELGSQWCERYAVLEDSIKAAVAAFPKPLGRAVEALAILRYDFGGTGGHMTPD